MVSSLESLFFTSELNKKSNKPVSKRDKFTKKRNRDEEDDEQNLDNLFSFIITGGKPRGNANTTLFNRNPNIDKELKDVDIVLIELVNESFNLSNSSLFFLSSLYFL